MSEHSKSRKWKNLISAFWEITILSFLPYKAGLRKYGKITKGTPLWNIQITLDGLAEDETTNF